MIRLAPPTGLCARFIDLQLRDRLERFERLEDLVNLHFARLREADGEDERIARSRLAIAQLDRELGLREVIDGSAEQLVAASPLLQTALLCDLYWFYHRTDRTSRVRHQVLLRARQDERMFSALGIAQLRGATPQAGDNVKMLWHLPHIDGLQLEFGDYVVLRLCLAARELRLGPVERPAPADNSRVRRHLQFLRTTEAREFLLHGGKVLGRGRFARMRQSVAEMERTLP